GRLCRCEVRPARHAVMPQCFAPSDRVSKALQARRISWWNRRFRSLYTRERTLIRTPAARRPGRLLARGLQAPHTRGLAMDWGNGSTAVNEGSRLWTLEEIGRLTSQQGNPAETLTNVAHLIQR